MKVKTRSRKFMTRLRAMLLGAVAGLLFNTGCAMPPALQALGQALGLAPAATSTTPPAGTPLAPTTTSPTIPTSPVGTTAAAPAVGAPAVTQPQVLQTLPTAAIHNGDFILRDAGTAIPLPMTTVISSVNGVAVPPNTTVTVQSWLNANRPAAAAATNPEITTLRNEIAILQSQLQVKQAAILPLQQALQGPLGALTAPQQAQYNQLTSEIQSIQSAIQTRQARLAALGAQ